ncbi:desmethyl-deoxy-podophyllotoxin synthase isoform X2 [Oryza sativa Japonica Group]|uniref:desmethyl-deoxy-podophyllotoxin synthase isoform X2 n=1 Tax=Oryza sativa subsp. japonica TaxID=39947 RepID=UPI00339CDDD5
MQVNSLLLRYKNFGNFVSIWCKTTQAMADQLVHLPQQLLVLLLFIAPFFFFFLIRSMRRRDGGSVRLPPSPWALPVIGHLHHLMGALPPHHAMRDIALRHGPLVRLRLGGLQVILASSVDAAREVMRTHDLAFATRPSTRGIVFTPYGDSWRNLRKICTVELLSAKRVQSFRPIREEEVGRLLRAVAAASPARRAVNLSELISAYSADSTMRALIGSRFKDRDRFLMLLERGVKLFATPSLPDLYPSSRLAELISRRPRQMRRHRDEVYAFLDIIIKEHQENRSSSDDQEDLDLVDVLLRIQRKGDFPLSTDNIKTTIGDLFNGGSETTATTLKWIMAELVRNPRVMQKAQDEVRRALGKHHKVTEEALKNLSYLHLVIKEGLRLHPPGLPLLLRESRTTSQVLGFDVPQGTMILVNMWAISRDPMYWDQAEEFIPERFEHVNIDYYGTDVKYMPFGVGRRICPGIAFGLVNLELVLASLLYHFDWELPDGTELGNLDMKEEMGAIARRLHDLSLVPVIRHPLPVDM